MRILTSAQPFGYGPASKLVTLAKWLRPQADYHIDFLGDDVALTYVLQNSLYFNNIFEYSGEYPNHAEYDLVISVMNPYIVIWAWIHNIKSIYVDSLFWFWNWDESRFDHLESIIEELKSVNKIDEAWALVKDVDPHDMQYIAYKLTNKSLVQKFSFEADQKAQKDKFRDNLEITYIDPVIDISKRKSNKERNKVIVSLSGLLSPLNREKEALRYSSLVMNLLDEMIGDLPDNVEVFLTTNPNVITKIRPINERINLVSLSNNAFLELLNETVILFAPAGITTLLESLSYDVPIFFLPEQHDGHYKNYMRLTNALSEREAFPEILFNTRIVRSEESDPDKEIVAIQSLIKKGAQNLNEPILQQMKKELDKSLRIVNNDKERNSLLQGQQELLKIDSKMTINFDDYIVEVINSSDKNCVRRTRAGLLSNSKENRSLNSELTNLGKTIGSLNTNIIDLSDKGVRKLSEIAKKSGSKVYAFTPSKNLHEYKEIFKIENVDIYNKIYFLNTNQNNLLLNFVEETDHLIVLTFDNRNLFCILAAIQLGKTVFGTKEVIKSVKNISNMKIIDIREYNSYFN